MRATAKAFDNITKEEFQAYEDVRVSGVVNMWDSLVCRLAHISRETHLDIITHYTELAHKWPDVRDLGKGKE